MAEHAGHIHGHEGSGEDVAAHVPVRVYVYNVIALMGLLIITLVAAAFDLGTLNTLIAMTIAVIKMLLVVLFFMHVRWSSRLTWLFAGAAFFWLSIMFTFTLSDYTTRSWLPG
jgi:cytochrome c oxidase subunit IV